ncbi:MAG TPA: hypothetical protein PLR20_08685 [Syntrophales bacterium]|nr:hypothetical protein [Syntrophales bacterium]HOX95027.1 hypothetical protein [Syntrophales bacterium]HPI57290.1 hypothetical protein [Syntrophales bacterium]HPN25170.1 hypothetical protein [Syntrophales bacterium]HQM29410.1 hypothetical protein [Syntrophales bacterium]
MNVLPREELKALMMKQEGSCVTLYMPTHRGGAEVQQNPIRLKNLLRQAEEKLLAGGVRAADVEKFMEPAQALLKNTPFWKQHGEGLAVFLSSEHFKHYRLPVDVPELVVVTERFHIKPLLSLYSANGQFYILALSQKGVRFLEGSRFSVNEMALEGVPKSIMDAMKYDVLEKQRLNRPSGSGPSQARGSIEWTAYTKEDTLRYFKQIDRGLHGILKDKKAPLVFAGVDYLFPIYREVNSYPHLVDRAVTGNPESLSVEELRKQAWAIVEPYFQKRQEEARAQYRQSVGTGLASGNILEIVPAAHHGRVGILFAAVGVQQWGSFRPDSGEVTLREKAAPGDEDLIDLAVIQTLLNAGTVYAVKRDEMPETEPLAAVFRY